MIFSRVFCMFLGMVTFLIVGIMLIAGLTNSIDSFYDVLICLGFAYLLHLGLIAGEFFWSATIDSRNSFKNQMLTKESYLK